MREQREKNDNKYNIWRHKDREKETWTEKDTMLTESWEEREKAQENRESQ